MRLQCWSAKGIVKVDKNIFYGINLDLQNDVPHDSGFSSFLGSLPHPSTLAWVYNREKLAPVTKRHYHKLQTHICNDQELISRDPRDSDY